MLCILQVPDYGCLRVYTPCIVCSHLLLLPGTHSDLTPLGLGDVVNATTVSELELRQPGLPHQAFLQPGHSSKFHSGQLRCSHKLDIRQPVHSRGVIYTGASWFHGLSGTWAFQCPELQQQLVLSNAEVIPTLTVPTSWAFQGSTTAGWDLNGICTVLLQMVLFPTLGNAACGKWTHAGLAS